MMVGSQPVRLHDTTRAKGFKPYFLTASSLATTTAPAPSLIPEALAAVTTLEKEEEEEGEQEEEEEEGGRGQ